MGLMFHYETIILEHHLDSFGHVNNAVYLELFEQARWDFISKRGFGLTRIMNERLGPVILDLNLLFKRELHNRETIHIESRFSGFKNRLVMMMEQKMFNEQNALAGQLDFRMGLMDLTTRKLIKPTEDWCTACGVVTEDLPPISGT